MICRCSLNSPQTTSQPKVLGEPSRTPTSSEIPQKGDDKTAVTSQDPARVGVRGEHSPSVARALSDLERECLAALALSLPASWVVVIEPPYGQVAITPVKERHRHHRCWVASGSQRRIFKDDGR